MKKVITFFITIFYSVLLQITVFAHPCSFYRGELSTKTMIIPSFVCASFFAVYGIVRWYKEWIG